MFVIELYYKELCKLIYLKLIINLSTYIKIRVNR